MMFIFFIIIALFRGFRGQYTIDVMRIGAIFGFQSIILFVFVFFDKHTREIRTLYSKIPVYIVTAVYVCLLVCCVILGSYNAFPYNTDTTVPWGSDSTYAEKLTSFRY
jgi:hypothetical protein